MPSTVCSSVVMVLDSSTVITPSLPTLVIASAMMVPMVLSLLAEMVPTWAIFSLSETVWDIFLTSSTATSTACSIPRFRAIGLAPAATAFTPSRKITCARMVAVVVPSPATSLVLEATSRTICAPMFSSGSLSSISFATVTPSLVMTGAPNFFSMTALRPLGPRVIFTASARILTPRRIDWREFSPVTICFAMILIPPEFLRNGYREGRRQVKRCAGPARKLLFAGRFRCAADLGEDFVFLEDEKFLVVDLDVVAAVFAEQDAVTGLDVEGNQLALFAAAVAHGDDFAFLRLFLGRVRDDDAALHGLLLFQPPHQHAVVQRSDVDCHVCNSSDGEFRIAWEGGVTINQLSTPHRRVLI